MNAKVLAAGLLSIASVTLIGCGGGGGDDVKWEGFKFVSQEFTLDKISRTVKVPIPSAKSVALPLNLSGRIFMGFDADDASGFGIDLTYSTKIETPQLNMEISGNFFYMYSIEKKMHYLCNTTTMKGGGTNPETGEKISKHLENAKSCMYMDAPLATKKTFNDCAIGATKDLTVTDADGLHKVRMTPRGLPEEVPAEYLYVDNSNMIKKVDISYGQDIQTVTGTSKAIAAAMFAPPAAYDERFWPGTKVSLEDAMKNLPDVPAELPIQALMACVGLDFKPGPHLMAANLAKMAPAARAHVASMKMVSETKHKMVTV